jgi:hypothetical protein
MGNIPETIVITVIIGLFIVILYSFVRLLMLPSEFEDDWDKYKDRTWEAARKKHEPKKRKVSQIEVDRAMSHFYRNRMLYLEFFESEFTKDKVYNISADVYIYFLYNRMRGTEYWYYRNVNSHYEDDYQWTLVNLRSWNPATTPFEKQFYRQPYGRRYSQSYGGAYSKTYTDPFDAYSRSYQQQQQAPKPKPVDLTAKYCKSLDIESTTDFTVIKAAYKVKMKKNHPDKFTNSPAHIYNKAVENTKKINEAYTYLEKQYGKQYSA